MTAKELLDSKGTSTINVVKLMEEYAEIKILDAKIERIFNLLGLKHIEVIKKVVLNIQLKGEFSTEDLKQLSDMLPNATSILSKSLKINIATLRIRLKFTNLKSDILFNFFDELEIAYGLINR